MHAFKKSAVQKTALAATAGALALSMAACGSSSGKAATNSSGKPVVRIMVGGMSKQIYLPAMLAQQLGYFSQQGLDVQLSDEPAGVNAEDQMLAGQVDAVVGFYDHNIDLQAKGKSTESVVQLLQSPGEVEMVRTDEASTITSAANFGGKNLGITDIGSSTDFLTQALAVHAGVSVSNIHRLGVQAGTTFISAMEHKQIDAGMTTEPTVSALLQKGDAKILIDMRTATGTEAALGGDYPASCLYMSAAYVNNNKPVVQKLANAFVNTLRWIQSHSAAEIAAKMPADYYSGVGLAAYVKALDGEKGMYDPTGLMPASGPKTVLNVLSSFNSEIKGANIDLSKTYTDEFVNAAPAS